MKTDIKEKMITKISLKDFPFSIRENVYFICCLIKQNTVIFRVAHKLN